MSIVQQELTIDDRYSQEIIGKARDLSVQVDNYLVEQRYLLEADETQLNPLWIRYRVLRILIDELGELGIFFNRQSDDILDDVVMHQAIIFLRSKFTGDTFFEMIKNNENLIEQVKELLGEDCVVNLIELMNSTFPLDEGWEYLSKRGVAIGSNDLFIDHIQAIFRRVEAYGDPSYETQCTFDQVNAYLQYVEKRNNIIEQMACSCFPVTVKDPNDDAVMTADSQSRYAIKKYMESYEKEMTRGNVLYKAVSIFSNETIDMTEKLNRIEILKEPYRRNHWKHALKWWLIIDGMQKKSIITDYIIAIIVASFYQNGMTSMTLRSVIEKALSDADGCLPQPNSCFVDKLRTCMDRMIIPEIGVSTHETY